MTVPITLIPDHILQYPYFLSEEFLFQFYCNKMQRCVASHIRTNLYYVFYFALQTADTIVKFLFPAHKRMGFYKSEKVPDTSNWIAPFTFFKYIHLNISYNDGQVPSVQAAELIYTQKKILLEWHIEQIQNSHFLSFMYIYTTQLCLWRESGMLRWEDMPFKCWNLEALNPWQIQWSPKYREHMLASKRCYTCTWDIVNGFPKELCCHTCGRSLPNSCYISCYSWFGRISSSP